MFTIKLNKRFVQPEQVHLSRKQIWIKIARASQKDFYIKNNCRQVCHRYIRGSLTDRVQIGVPNTTTRAVFFILSVKVVF